MRRCDTASNDHEEEQEEENAHGVGASGHDAARVDQSIQPRRPFCESRELRRAQHGERELDVCRRNGPQAVNGVLSSTKDANGVAIQWQILQFPRWVGPARVEGRPSDQGATAK